MKTQIELDSIVAMVPPTYKLNYLVTYGGKRLTPLTPLQIIPIGGCREVYLRFWGMNTYDVHVAFPSLMSRGKLVPEVAIRNINYTIIVVGMDEHSIRADYQHPFEHTVKLDIKGLHGMYPIFKMYRTLEHLPRLPQDWQYIQFIG